MDSPKTNNHLVIKDSRKKIIEVEFNAEQIKRLYGLENLNNSQLATFRQFCIDYSLDPLLKHIYAWEQDGQLIIHVGLLGWLDIANRQTTFDGIDKGIIYKGDRFKKLPRGSYEHEPGGNWGDNDYIKQAYAIVYRKDRSIPSLSIVSWATYNKPNHFAWKKYKEEMLEKTAIARAIRESFGISDLHPSEDKAIEETGTIIDVETEESEKKEEQKVSGTWAKRIRGVMDCLYDDEIPVIYGAVQEELSKEGCSVLDYDRKFPGALDKFINQAAEAEIKKREERPPLELEKE